MDYNNTDACPVEPLAPLDHVIFHKQVTVKEAYDLLDPELQGLFFSVLVARADAHRTAAVLAETEEEQGDLLRALDRMTDQTLNHILTFPTAFAIADARGALRDLSCLPDHLQKYLDIGRKLSPRHDDEEDIDEWEDPDEPDDDDPDEPDTE